MKAGKNALILILSGIFIWSCNSKQTPDCKDYNRVSFVKLQTDNAVINKAFRIALGDLFSNIQDFPVHINDTISPVILAGLEYDSPWTRDASINCWNAGSFIVPEIARNTLLAVLADQNDSLVIQRDTQYWDAIIWCSGAWDHYLWTGDHQFLKTAYEVTKNSLQFFEQTEFNKKYNLFRGLGWSDGVSAYEGKYVNTGGSSAAFDWPKYNPDEISKPGFGIPMMSTYANCLYYNAYIVADKMEKELNKKNSGYKEKAAKLKDAINKHLWNETTGLYKFYIDETEESNLQTTYGNALTIMFGIASEDQAELLFKNQHVTPAGVPCEWPPLTRYCTDSTTFARHNAVIWPQIQGFWVQAASIYKKEDMLFHELSVLAKHAVRDMQFGEIYHPVTGELYGGMQERKGKIALWQATNRQTWSATAYIRMIIHGLLGMNLNEHSLSFSPCVPKGLSKIVFSNLRYRNTNLHVEISGTGSQISKIFIDGQPSTEAIIPDTLRGDHSIKIVVSEDSNI